MAVDIFEVFHYTVIKYSLKHKKGLLTDILILQNARGRPDDYTGRRII